MNPAVVETAQHRRQSGYLVIKAANSLQDSLPLPFFRIAHWHIWLSPVHPLPQVVDSIGFNRALDPPPLLYSARIAISRSPRRLNPSENGIPGPRGVLSDRVGVGADVGVDGHVLWVQGRGTE